MGITLGPARPTFCPFFGVLLKGMVAFYSIYVQKRPKITAYGGTLANFGWVKLVFSGFSRKFFSIVGIVWALKMSTFDIFKILAIDIRSLRSFVQS